MNNKIIPSRPKISLGSAAPGPTPSNKMALPERNRNLILSLPAELLNSIFTLLDPVTSTCLGLSSKHLYPIHCSFHGIVSLARWAPPPPAPPLARLIETWMGGGRPYDGGLDFVYSGFSNKFMYLEAIEALHRSEMDRLGDMEKSRKAEKRHIERELKIKAQRSDGRAVRRLQERYVTVGSRKLEIEPRRRILRSHLHEARVSVRKKAKRFGVLKQDGIYKTSRELFLTEGDDEEAEDFRNFTVVLGDI